MRTWLRNKRTSKNVTQAALASQVGISRTMITEIENGKANPSVDVAKRIAAVLGFDWTLFYEDDEADPQSA